MVCSSVNRTDLVQMEKHYYSDEETAVDVQLYSSRVLSIAVLSGAIAK